MPRIRAAIKINKPPIGVMFGDPDAKWTKWDLRLVMALEIHDNMMQGGIPLYWDRSDRVRFEVESYVSKSKAVLDRAEAKAAEGKTKNYGKIFYVKPHTVDGGPLPTLEEFLEEQASKQRAQAGNIRIKDNTPFSNAGWKPKDAPVLFGPVED